LTTCSDEELAKALDACDVLIAVIGPRWMDLLRARTASGERDYVREESAEALRRRIVVIPARVGREGQMPTLPRPGGLPFMLSYLGPAGTSRSADADRFIRSLHVLGSKTP
jgi:hypothetical protein